MPLCLQAFDKQLFFALVSPTKDRILARCLVQSSSVSKLLASIRFSAPFNACFGAIAETVAGCPPEMTLMVSLLFKVGEGFFGFFLKGLERNDPGHQALQEPLKSLPGVLPYISQRPRDPIACLSSRAILLFKLREVLRKNKFWCPNT